MNINIYYGGRGLIDDPSLFVINKMQEVLEELRVNVECYHLHECKNTITTLPQTLKDADAVILATTVEWYGIGGYMQQFLDSCWLYGDKEKISEVYMCPVVMSTTYGEREAQLNLITAWEILGGRLSSGICGYIADTVSLEMNAEYTHIIEKKAENLYRTVNQKMARFPASNQAVKNMVATKQNIDLTPQETEQLSQYASDDGYVQQQKEDIQELASLFRDMMSENENEEEYVREFQKAFHPQPGVLLSCCITVEEKKKSLLLKIKGADFSCSYGAGETADLEMQMTKNVIEDIVHGRMSFQRAFMTGAMKMRGDFKQLRGLDAIFVFEE